MSEEKMEIGRAVDGVFPNDEIRLGLSAIVKLPLRLTIKTQHLGDCLICAQGWTQEPAT
jgi:hypothetical protein